MSGDNATCARFDQHIFAGDPYGTVARSDGLAQGDVELIERHAAGYDLTRAANEYRAFTLAPALDAGGGRRYAVMTTRGVPGVRGNNYLAHSYIVSENALAAISGNWAWLTLRLPPLGEYQPLRTRLDRLPAVEKSLDPVGQFRYFRFLVAEQPAGRVEALLCELLRHLEQPGGRPLAIEYAPPHTELAALLQDTFAVRPPAPPPVPSADNLALIRTIGLLAPLPLAFQLRASYSLNGAAIAGDCAFTVIANADRPARNPGRILGFRYVRFCVALAESDSDDALQHLRDLRDWMSHFLGVASTDALETAFAVYHDVCLPNNVASDGRTVSPVVLAERLAALARSGNVRMSALFELVSKLDFDRYSLAERLRSWRALTPFLASGDLARRVSIDVRQAMSSSDPALRFPAIELFRSLAPDAQVQLWAAAALDNAPPASASIELQLACVTSETLHAAQRAGVAMLDHMIAGLPTSGLAWPRLTGDLEPLVARLLALAHSNALASTRVLPALVERIVQCFATSSVEPRQLRLSEALGLLLRSPELFGRGRPRHVPEVIAHAIAACWRWSPADIDPRLVLHMPPVEQRDDMRLMLDMLALFIVPHYPLLRETIEVQGELLSATLQAFSDIGYRNALLHVPRYAEAIDPRRAPQDRRMPVHSRAQLEEIHSSLHAEVSERSVPATAAVLLGTSYLNHWGGNPSLFEATASRTVEMIRTSPRAFPRSLRARILAELFAASESCKRPELLDDIAAFLIADDQEAEALCAQIGSILAHYKRDPPAWKAVEKQRSSWRSRRKPRERS